MVSRIPLERHWRSGHLDPADRLEYRADSRFVRDWFGGTKRDGAVLIWQSARLTHADLTADFIQPATRR